MQSAHRRGSKKRKPDVDIEAERSLYSAFASAANSVSQLYSIALSQQSRHRDEGARQSLERVYEWLCKEYGSSEVLPTAALMDFLRQEALMLGQPGESSGAVAAQPPMPPAVFSSAVAAAKQGDVAESADKLLAMPRRGSYPQSAPQLMALQHEQAQLPSPQFPPPPGWGNQ